MIGAACRGVCAGVGMTSISGVVDLDPSHDDLGVLFLDPIRNAGGMSSSLLLVTSFLPLRAVIDGMPFCAVALSLTLCHTLTLFCGSTAPRTWASSVPGLPSRNPSEYGGVSVLTPLGDAGEAG